MDTQASQAWLKTMAKDPTQRRDVLIGTGIIGDPLFVPTLLKQMETPELARAAGAAFSMITGINLAEENLEGAWPDGFEAGPNDDPEDENVDMDPDEDLPWPNALEVANWWAQHKGEYERGIRHLSGLPVSPEHCTHVMKSGLQPQRVAASLELALSQAELPWFNTKAKGNQQISHL